MHAASERQIVWLLEKQAMAENIVDIGLATENDLDGIMVLQEENQPEHGGSLSASIPRNLISKIMCDTPVIVARFGGCIIGYLVTSTKKMNIDIPFVNAMLATNSGATEFYVYGPICVKAEERGKGLAQAMYAELRRLVPDREYILLIRGDNSASLRVHRKMGMREVTNFLFGGNDYVVLSSFGSSDKTDR